MQSCSARNSCHDLLSCHRLWASVPTCHGLQPSKVQVMIINCLSLEVEYLLECWQDTAYGLGVRTCAEHAWSPGSVPASKINNRLFKVVAIFTLALESSHVTRLSIGSCFTVTLDSDDVRWLRQISSRATEGSSLGSCAASWITNISPTCLALSDFIPARGM